MQKWEYCEAYLELAEDSMKALVAFTSEEARRFEGREASFPRLFKVLGEEGWEAIGLVSRRFTNIKTAEGEILDKAGTEITYLLKRPRQN